MWPHWEEGRLVFSPDALGNLPELRMGGGALRLLDKSSQNAYHMPGVRLENGNRACDFSRMGKALTSVSLLGGTQSGQKFADPVGLQWLTQGSLVPIVDSKLTVFFSFLILLSLLLSIKKKNHTDNLFNRVSQFVQFRHPSPWPQASQLSLLETAKAFCSSSALPANLVLSRHF